MKIAGQFKQQLKSLGQNHIQFMEAELQQRGIQILSANVRHTLKFSGCWQVKFQGEEFTIKVSDTGTALTYHADGLNTWGSHTHRDFDELVKGMQANLPKVTAYRQSSKP